MTQMTQMLANSGVRPGEGLDAGRTSDTRGLPMLSVREALDLVLRDLAPLGSEQVPLPQALGRVLAAAVRATRDIPPFRNSAMDGYAVRAIDTTSATARAAVRLRILEVIGAGALPRQAVGQGTATKIMTGSPMPEGADAVVRIEDTAEREGIVDVQIAVAAGANVRHPGEDMCAGETVLTPGRALRPADIGLLASLGTAVVGVHRRPVVVILSTGDELVELGQPLAPGQIVNSNAYTLAAAVEEAGGTARVLGIVRDTVEATRGAFLDAFNSDVVLSTGGVSMGTFDLVRATLAELGVVEHFWKVAQKPGKPLAFGMHDGVPVFGLPGNPVSSLVCFYLSCARRCVPCKAWSACTCPRSTRHSMKRCTPRRGSPSSCAASWKANRQPTTPAPPARKAPACCAHCHSATA